MMDKNTNQNADETSAHLAGWAKRAEFMRNADAVKKCIASWPTWKQQALGDVPRMPIFKRTPNLKAYGKWES